MMKKTLWIFLLPCALFAQDCCQFESAKAKFNPWYTGPLVTASATAMDPGYGNFEPYAFVIDNYGRYKEDRHSTDIPNLVQLNPKFFFQAGIASWMDTALLLQTLTSWQSHQHGGSIGDTTWTLGFPLAKQSCYIPNIKVTISETFPTGRYQNLKARKLGTDDTGAGSFETIFGLAASKVVFWTWDHPLNLRLQLDYGIHSSVHVHGLNHFGGAIDTDGKVKPGNTFQADLGVECSISKRWVFITDVVYTTSARDRFDGFPGTLPDGSPAVVGNHSNDQLSLAPAFEYNLNKNISFLGSCWFTVYGRNSYNFASGIISFSYTFSFTD